MRLVRLNIANFRCFAQEHVTFESDYTVLVGGNGSGKSTVGVAIERLLLAIRSNLTEGVGVTPTTMHALMAGDRRHGGSDEPGLSVELELSKKELDELIISPLVGASGTTAQRTAFSTHIGTGRSRVTVRLVRDGRSYGSEIGWGQLTIRADQVHIGQPAAPPAQRQKWSAGGLRGIASLEGSGQWNQGEDFVLDRDFTSIPDRVGDYLRNCFKLVPEFRARSQSGKQSAALESLDGSDLPNVLFNLKNHRERNERDRYEKIQQVFNHFSQRFTVEVNDSSPGARVPVLQFYEGEDSSSVLGEQMSAGLHQMLGLIANLVGREGLVIFLEHPEEHLHPQSMRYLQNMVVESSERNQLIVTTHSPYFINPGRLDGLRRFWIAKDGAKVKKAAYMKCDKREAARFETALREVGRREMLFARAVILTEEDTTVAFLAGISDVLKKDVNAHGVSIVSVGGDSAFVPYHALLDSLEIPHVNLRDGSWGDNPKYPKERFFSFDAESFEKFMDRKGFCELRKRIAGELGASERSRKPEVARELARRLKPEQVPDIFRTVLDKALELAKAEPKLDTEVPHANN